MENITTKRTLKELPYTPTRGQIYDMFYKINKETVKDEINEIMAAHRKTSVEKIRLKKRIFNPEWKQLLRFLGIPEGYKNPEWL